MLTVDQALEQILSRVNPLASVAVPLRDVLGRVLAETVYADADSPPFANSAVDGYAVRASDVVGRGGPVTLRVTGETHAGGATSATVLLGTAVRIMTGAPMPAGADAVVMIEDTRVEPDGTVRILEASEVDRHVRPAGGDFRAGNRLLEPGTRIRPPEIALLAAAGRTDVTVHRTPTVAVLSTGDELISADRPGPLPFGCIRDSNLPALTALVEEAGAHVHSAGHVPDDLESVVAALQSVTHTGPPADVIVTAGGVSVGDRDYVKPALERLGKLELWRVAMKPGKPLAFGSIGDTVFFGLPGNPVSALVTFELFVRPALLRMMGRRPGDLDRPTVEATLLENVAHTSGRREYVRAVTATENGRFVTRPTGEQGSSLIRSMTLANSLITVREESGDLSAGAIVNVMMLW